MQWQPSFKSQGVTCPKTCDGHTGLQQCSRHLLGMVRSYRNFKAVFSGVSGSGHNAIHPQQVDRGYTKSLHTRGFWRQRSNTFAGTWALHRQDCASAGGVVTADDGAHTVSVGCVRHHVEDVRAQPPHDDVVTHPALFVARVRVLRATRCDLAQIVGQFTLQ